MYNKKELSIRACVSYREKFLHLRQCHLLLDLCHHLLFLGRAHLVQGLLIHDVDLLAAAQGNCIRYVRREELLSDHLPIKNIGQNNVAKLVHHFYGNPISPDFLL